MDEHVKSIHRHTTRTAQARNAASARQTLLLLVGESRQRLIEG